MFPSLFFQTRYLHAFITAGLLTPALNATDAAHEHIRGQLTSKLREDRITGMANAHLLGTAAIPILESVFLKDGSESHYPMHREERLLALDALSRIKSPDIAPTLLLAAGDLEQAVREKARLIMLSLKATQIQKIREHWLYSQNWFVRQGSMVTLLESGVETAALVAEACAVLRSPNDSRRTSAIQILGQLESRDAIGDLRRLLMNPAEPLSLRLEALGSLHYLDGSAVPMEAWTLALGEEGMRNLYMATLSGVHIAMSHLEAGGVKALPVITDLLSDSDPLKRMRAAFLLGRIGPPATSSLERLKMLEKDPVEYVATEVQPAVARILQQPRAPIVKRSFAKAPHPVTVEDGGQTFHLQNGLLHVGIDKSKGTVVSLSRPVDTRNLFGEKGSWYNTFPWTLPRGSRVPSYTQTKARIVRQSPELIEIAVNLSLEKPRPLQIEHHYVMRRGLSGIYRFTVMDKPEENNIPENSIFDFALFMKVDGSIFRRAAVSDTLQGELEPPEKTLALQSQMRELSNATHRLPDGRIWAKYSWCAYEQETRVHGVSGEGVGLWVILPNDESGYNLPTCYPGTVHEAGESIVIVTHQEGTPHNIGSEQRANIRERSWKKLYGPALLYVNTGSSHAQMWSDAKNLAEMEAASLPASWMEHDLYPLRRASVTGRVTKPDGTPAAGAWVMICIPNPDPERAWQRHLGPYLWRGWTDAEGRFAISGVRPGTYSVIARIDGVPGSARRDAVTLHEDEVLAIDTLAVSGDQSGHLLWQIGIPDGTPREFAGAVDSHEWCGWIRNYRRLFPSDVLFRIGNSDPAKDWYYCQPGGWPETYGGKLQPTKWWIRFDLPNVPPEGAILTIGIAATRGGLLRIECNDHALPALNIDESDYRTSVCMAPDRGAYYGFRTVRFYISPDKLTPGANEVSLRFGKGNSRFEAIMYDYLKLESAGSARVREGLIGEPETAGPAKEASHSKPQETKQGPE